MTARAGASVLTNSANLERNGWYPDQSALTPGTVTGGTFGQLFDASVVGQVYAQPIVSEGTLLVATEDNHVYGLDPQTGAQQWTRTYGTPFNASDIACGDLAPHVGITGTPVVDPATNVAYFTDKEYVSGNSGASRYLAHAINVATGDEVAGWPVEISGYADNASHIDAHLFHPNTQLQRPGLLLMNGVVYAAFGSSCDVTPFNGWIVGISTTTHQITTKFVTTRDDNAGAGIWQAGSGLMSDRNGDIVFSTGNGGWDAPGPLPGNSPPNDLAEMVVRVHVQPDGSLEPVDFFAPYDSAALEQNDLDFGSGGPVALPDAYFGAGTNHPHLLAMEGKQGYVYLLDRDNLGGYLQGAGGGDNVVSRIGPYGGVWSRPAVWPGDGGYVYFVTANSSGHQTAGSSGFMRAYKYGVDGNNNPTLSLAGTSTDTFGFGSGAPVVTSNGAASGSAVLWEVWLPDGSGANAQLRAYDPVPVNGHFNLLWSAPIGTGSKFSMPAVDNAHVYVGTRDGHVRAFWSPVSVPMSVTPPVFTPSVVGQPETQSIVFTAKQALTVTGFTSTNPAFTFGTSTPPAGSALGAGDTISVPVTFTPTQIGLSGATVRANTSLGPVDVPVSALGEAADAQLVISPSLLSLGGTEVGGQPLSGSITLTNAGNQPLVIGATDLPADAQYQVTGYPAPGTTMAAGASISATVQFTPAAAEGEFDSSLTVHATDVGGTVDLSQSVDFTAVVADPPHVDISPMNIDLGDVPLGATVDAKFTLDNTGALGASFVRSKPPAKNVGFVARTALPEGSSLPAGASLTETVRFSATKLGTFTDAWSLNAADGQGARNVSFTAHVVPSGKVPAPSSARWKLNGTAKFTNAPDAGALQLTPPTTPTVAGSAFLTTPVPSRYVRVSFDAWIGGGVGADGLALVLADASQASANSLGVAGGGLGYSGTPGIAIALDTYQNAVNPSGNFVGISDGPTSPGADLLHWVAANSGIPPLEVVNALPPTGYRRTHVDVEIANNLATVKVGGNVALDDVPVVVPPNVLIGFSAGSGGAYDEHTVSNVHITLAAPETTIHSRPPATTTSANASFSFASSFAASTFVCRLDNGPAAPCRSPRSLGVSAGRHTFTVQAVDAHGVADPTPAIAKWTYSPIARGYWMLGADGAVYGFGSARMYGAPHDPRVTHLTPTVSARGYWVVNSVGHVYPYGDARSYGDATALLPGERVTSMGATPTGKGYWLFTSLGRAVDFGDAAFFGDMSRTPINRPVIGAVVTPSGRGYYMVASDGGVFTFGDARFHGSMGAVRLNQPIVGLVPTPSGKGYWLDAADGGVFAFGDATFRGSLGSTRLVRPIVGMVRFGTGYLLAAADGGVFNFSNLPFLGSLGSTPIPAPVIALGAFGL